jgi:hypothetical protein
MAAAVGPLVAFGVLPDPAAGAQIDVSVGAPEHWGVLAFARTFESQSRSINSSVAVHLATTSGGAAVCPLRLGRARSLLVDLCGGVEVAALESVSQGFSAVQSNAIVVVRIVGDAHVSAPLAGPIALRAGGEVGVAPVRSDLVYDDAAGEQHDIFNPWLVAAAADIELVVSVP